MKSLKDFKKIKTKRIVPLGIKGSSIGITSPVMTPKLTVEIGINIQEDLPSFAHDYFDIDLLDGELVLVLSQKGQRAIRVRTEKDPKYLDKTIQAFRKRLKALK